jgi:DNA-binding transcriptional MerR regulator
LYQVQRIVILHEVPIEDSAINCMAYKEKEIEKIYYSIGEVAEQFNVAPSLIRFWESEFELIQPKKNRKGNRQFTKEDIENVRTIYHLVKQKGFTLQGAKEMLRNDTSAVKDKMEIYDSLKKIRQFLVEVRDKLQ